MRYNVHSGQYYAYTYDPQGNLVQRHSQNGGPVFDVLEYDAFGLKREDFAAYQSSPETYTDPVGFGGQFGYYTDPETSLVLLTHRYYDPRLGRFVTRDPIGYKGGINLYGFAGSNPVNESDPSGYFGTLVDGAVDLGFFSLCRRVHGRRGVGRLHDQRGDSRGLRTHRPCGQLVCRRHVPPGVRPGRSGRGNGGRHKR